MEKKHLQRYQAPAIDLTCNHGYKVHNGEGPQPKLFTASLFINAHEVMKEERKASCGRYKDVENISYAQRVRRTFDGDSRPGDWNV
eukprot:1160267-Pelagomonas_calceolata.AAC.5